jgi:CBS domain-containing protein
VKTIAQLLEIKGHDVWSISPDASVYEAIEKMADKEVGALLVLQDGKLVGIISERDYTRKVILKGRASTSTRVREIMTHRVIHIRPEESLERCMVLMTEKHIRHLPVLTGDQLIGVVSIGDLVKAIISYQGSLIQQLENHILEYTRIT